MNAARYHLPVNWQLAVPHADAGRYNGFTAANLRTITEIVSGHSKPAREGQMKTGHFESGIAHGAAIADQMRDEPTQCEPATFHRHAGGQRLVGAQDRPRTGCASRDGRPR